MNRIRHWVFGLLLLSLALFGAASGARADNAAFDLAGPEIEMTVNRAGKTLPIAEVPNLQAGDRLWIHPVLPDDQSVHYLLVVAFLRGTTNPPPDEWFTRVETWNRNVRAEGILVNVPQDAQQALLFWPRNRRRLRHAARRGSQQARSFRARLAGFESSQPGPHPLR